MSDLPRQLGPYRVVHAIGRGGVGVAYLARDQRLYRDAAIKCLPEDIIADDEASRPAWLR